MRTWTKPMLVKDTMELSQYSIAACTEEYYEITIRCDSLAGWGHPGGQDSYTWHLTVPAADYQQHDDIRYFIEHADQYGDYSRSEVHSADWLLWLVHSPHLVGDPVVINAS